LHYCPGKACFWTRKGTELKRDDRVIIELIYILGKLFKNYLLMKKYLLILAACISLTANAQTKIKKTVKAPPAKAEKKYEMKQYYFVMLVKGENRDRITDTAELNKIQAGHMSNIQKLAEQGKIVVAGPFGDDGKWRGIFIFDCKTQEEVEGLLKTDPAIASGRLDYKIHPWWTAKNCIFK